MRTPVIHQVRYSRLGFVSERCPPSRVDQTDPDVTMKRRMPPIMDLGNKAMLDRIVMNVVHLLGIIGVVTDPMLPKAALPQSKLQRIA